jgi:hypothetical protein
VGHKARHSKKTTARTDPWLPSATPRADLVGVVEILAGLLVALKPRYGAYLVAAWLGGIIVNLLSHWERSRWGGWRPSTTRRRAGAPPGRPSSRTCRARRLREASTRSR